MDAQTIIEQLQRDVKDKTLLVRFYNIHNGTDLWIDGLCWRNYDFDMEDYLHEEFGIELEGNLTFDVMDALEDSVKKHCFNKKGLFSQTDYDNLQYALAEVDEDVVDAAVQMGIPLASICADMYRGRHKDFVSFATDMFDELNLHEIPEQFRGFIDYEKVAESYEQQYYFCNGHVFDATYR